MMIHMATLFLKKILYSGISHLQSMRLCVDFPTYRYVMFVNLVTVAFHVFLIVCTEILVWRVRFEKKKWTCSRTRLANSSARNLILAINGWFVNWNLAKCQKPCNWLSSFQSVIADTHLTSISLISDHIWEEGVTGPREQAVFYWRRS